MQKPLSWFPMSYGSTLERPSSSCELKQRPADSISYCFHLSFHVFYKNYLNLTHLKSHFIQLSSVWINEFSTDKLFFPAWDEFVNWITWQMMNYSFYLLFSHPNETPETTDRNCLCPKLYSVRQNKFAFQGRGLHECRLEPELPHEERIMLLLCHMREDKRSSTLAM